MSQTALELIQTASKRLGDLILSVPTSAGTTTTLIDSLLKQYLQTLTQANFWVYGTQTVDHDNRCVERRASGFTKPTNTLSFEAAWPAAITAGTYEVHPRYSRSLILEWINDAVGQLGVYWYRNARDNVVETEEQTLLYPLPNTSYWTRIYNVEIESDPDSDVVGFPYRSAAAWNWRADPYTDQFGNQFWQLQFGSQPPPGRLLRIYGEAYYPALEDDDDILALSGMYERPAMTYIFDWVNYRAMEYDSLIGRTSDTDKSRQKMYDSLNKTRDWLTSMLQPTHKPSRVNNPYSPGSGLISSGYGSNDPGYFGATSQVSH